MRARCRGRSLRAMDDAMRARYFDCHAASGLVVGDPLKQLVEFSRHNLVSDREPDRAAARST